MVSSKPVGRCVDDDACDEKPFWASFCITWIYHANWKGLTNEGAVDQVIFSFSSVNFRCSKHYFHEGMNF